MPGQVRSTFPSDLYSINVQPLTAHRRPAPPDQATDLEVGNLPAAHCTTTTPAQCPSNAVPRAATAGQGRTTASPHNVCLDLGNVMRVLCPRAGIQRGSIGASTRRSGFRLMGRILIMVRPGRFTYGSQDKSNECGVAGVNIFRCQNPGDVALTYDDGPYK